MSAGFGDSFGDGFGSMSLDLLVEDWSDLTSWDVGTGVAVAAGQVQLPFHTGTTWGWARSTGHAWDLTGGASLAAPVTIPDDAGATLMELHPDPLNPDGDCLRWRHSGWGPWGIRAEYKVGSTDWVAGWLPYDPVEHRWWRIRQRDDELVTWDLSPDGIEWVTVAHWLPSFDTTALTITLRTQYDPDVDTPVPDGPALFGALNVLPARPVDPATIIAQDGAPYLAVDVQPDNVTGAFLVDDSDVDGDDRLAWSTTAAGSWENVVCDVRSVRIVRGAGDLAGPLTTVDAGLCTVELQDTERRFDPLQNADAIHVGTPVRVRAWGWDLAGELWDAVLFTGTIEDLPVRYVTEGPPLVTLSAVDLVADLVAWRSYGRDAPVGAGDTLLDRAVRILEEMGESQARIAQDVDLVAYAASHPATVLAQPWDELVAAKDAELGRAWVDRDSRLVLRTRFSELSGPVRGTLSDVHGDAETGTVHCCYRDIDAGVGTGEVTNRAVGSRRLLDPAGTATVVTVEDTASVARWRPHVSERMALEVETDEQTADWAEDLVSLAATPGLRVASVAPHPSREDLDNALDAWPAVCATDLGDRWLVRYRPEVGPIVDRAVGVLGIVHEVTPDDWLTTWLTADAAAPTVGNPSGWVTVDDSDLDSGDVLVPDSAQLAAVGFLGWTG